MYPAMNGSTIAALPASVAEAGSREVETAAPPRYIIEAMIDPLDNKSLVYRVTAMGFGPRADIQAMLQTIYRTF